jgi:4-alpha-glucanotransferase
MAERGEEIVALARMAGLADRWRDADGVAQQTSDADLAAVLDALGYPASTGAERRASQERLAAERDALPVRLTGDVGQPVVLPGRLAAAGAADLLLENGAHEPVSINAGRVPAIAEPGYHRLLVAGHEVELAVAPARCHMLEGRAAWGPAVQIPSLRGAGPFGDFEALGAAAERFADAGADLVAISPVHALLPGLGEDYSPYAPSSRLFLNTAFATPPRGEGGDAMIDWEVAVPAASDELRQAAAQLSDSERASLRSDADRSPGLLRHALFNALFLHHGSSSWRNWPREHQDPAGAAVAAFARAKPELIDVHLLGQRLASQKLRAVQDGCRRGGMRIGLLADLAVGVDPDGSDVWSEPEAFLDRLTIGAPPDPLGPTGQNWGLTTFSPSGLRRAGFAPWIALIRAALRHAGGVRIDHAFGLQRLWVIPQGEGSHRGAYLSYPFSDLLRILTLESHRHRGIVIAEDLGTTPAGFRERIEERAIPGMRVLWFERLGDGFAPSAAYPACSVAMTGTHDTPTVAGWWAGRDLEWVGAIDPLRVTPETIAARASDRARLWKAIGDGPQPDPAAPERVIDAAIAHVAAASSQLRIVPLEDLIGAREQPNMPGTIHEHPNWRQRMPARVDDLLKRPDVAARVKCLSEKAGACGIDAGPAPAT